MQTLAMRFRRAAAKILFFFLDPRSNSRIRRGKWSLPALAGTLAVAVLRMTSYFACRWSQEGGES